MFYTALLAAVLLSPCIATRMLMDDYVLALKAQPTTLIPALPSEPLSLFTFTTGDPATNNALMDEGAILPWWTEPRHLNAFFRPLSAATHVLDFRLWPSSSALMHVHSILWYALLLALLARVYRRLEPTAPLVIGVALLLYAIDDAHGATVGWIANRNAVVSLALALPALSAHHRGVQGSQLQRVLAPLWLTLGLCAGETAVCMVGYLAAYALCLDRRALPSRALSLAPYLLIFVAHQALYRIFHLGSFGSSAYHHPLSEPLAFARTLAYNLPILLSGELFIPIVDAAFWIDPRWRIALWLWAVASLGALAWLFRSWLRHDRNARFWALGMALSAVPVSASLPGERLLLALGIGAAPLLARFFMLPAPGTAAQIEPALADSGIQPAPGVSGVRPANFVVKTPRGMGRGLAPDLPPGPANALASGLVLIHLWAAVCGLPIRAYALQPLARAIDRFDDAMPRTAAVREQTVVVLSAPFDIMMTYLQVARAVHDTPRPKHLYWLSSASSATEVERVAPNALRVTQEAGFLHRPEETHYRADVHNLPVGARVERAGLHIDVASSMPDGRPRSVIFRFDEPLESAAYLFRVYRDGNLLPWQPGSLGGRIHFAAQDFFRLMALEAFR